ncbi:MAG: ATP-dependent helicase [Candidatus Nanopelagicales bacterium]|nr:ATP-dependent helicase [Candidatus Nanopelagicales bacterium]
MAIELNWPTAGIYSFDPDPAQAEVIAHRRGNLRVLAGPGTGKTSVIVAAVYDRLREGQSADSMLVLTYGRLAAAQLRDRLALMSQSVPVATTFHALAFRLLIGHDPGLRLMGSPEQDAVLREIVHKTSHLPAVLEPARSSRGLPEQIRGYIATRQALGMPPGAPADGTLAAGIDAIYAEYLDIIGFAGAMDYAQLIRRAVEVVSTEPPESVRKIRTVFVDEYQDTDPSQVGLLKAMAALGADVVAVGDPDQSIYGFRGADAHGILRFDQDFPYPSCSTVALSSTRRYGGQIAAVARRVVPANALGSIPAERVREHRQPRAEGDSAGQVSVRTYESEAAAADHIADLLRRVHSGTSDVFEDLRLDWSQMAVLVRSGSRDIPALQRALLAAGIPVQIARDDIPLVHTASVRPLLDVLRVAADPHEALTGDRAISLLTSPLIGLGPHEVTRLGRSLRQRERASAPAARSSAELIVECLRDPELLAPVDLDLAQRVGALAQILEVAQQRAADRVPPSRILDEVWRATTWPQQLRREALSGGRRSREANQALDAVMELFDQAEQMDRAFESVRNVKQFLEQLDAQVIPAAPNRQKAWNRNAVRLLTAHRSKGSQWPLVIVAGVQEGAWPDLRVRASLLTELAPGWREQQLLEERRLFFVACTRASRALVVSAVRSSTEDGPEPSAFLTLAAGDDGITEVKGRPQRPLTPAGVVAGLRQQLLEPHTSVALKQAVWQRLEALAQERDARGHLIFPWADPSAWWGHSAWTANDSLPWFDADKPLQLSASAVEGYVTCPRRWFLEKKAKAQGPTNTKLAFGNLLHLCARAVASGELPAREEDIDEVLEGVWHAVGYEAGWQSRYERDQARAATRRLLRWMQNTPGEFVGAEIEFVQEIELACGEELVLRGTADRVDRTGEQLVITDFKTGKPIRVADAASHVQLGLYRWVADLGALGAGGEAIAQLLFLREDPPKRQPELGAKVMAQQTPDVQEWLEPVVEAAVAGLRAELAPARPGPLCRVCAVATSCPADPRGQEVRP